MKSRSSSIFARLVFQNFNMRFQSCAIHILTFLALCSFTAFADQLTRQVSDSTSDAHAWGDTSQNYSVEYLNIGYNTSYPIPYYRAAMRFTNITIPQGATISSAYLKVRSRNNYSTAAYLDIQAEDVDDSDTFNYTPYIGSRTLTSSVVYWDVFDSWSSGSEYTSPNISSTVQEVINRSGWSSGNALSIFISLGLESGGARSIWSYDGSSTYAAKLEINYTVSNSYYVYGKINNFVGGTDADGDGYYETFDFDIGIDADAVPGPATVYGKMICNTTGQSWWSSSPWTVTGTPTDYVYFGFDETDFSGQFTGNTDLDFTVEIWNESKTTKLATDTTVSGEPVKADDYVPPVYAVYGVINNFVGGTDADGDGYYETFDFNIGIDADATPGPATVYGKMICNTTGQSWWSSSPWTVTGTPTDYVYFGFDETDFSGQFTGNTDLDFTVEIWNESKTTKLATDTTVSGEPVKADAIVIVSQNEIPGASNSPSSVPTYLNNPGMYFNPIPAGCQNGICWATAAADIFAYWDRNSYNGIIYWNLIDHGVAPLLQNNLPTVPGHSQADVRTIVVDLATRFYVNNQDEDAILEAICNTENDLSFNITYHQPVSSINDKINYFNTIQDEIDNGRPISIGTWGTYFGGAHQIPVIGYIEFSTTSNSEIYIHRNTGGDQSEYANLFDPLWGDLDMDSLVPGGTPNDEYEDDDQQSEASWIYPDDVYEFRQTHNFEDATWPWPDDEQDWVQFNAIAGRRYTIETENLGDNCDTSLQLDWDGTTFCLFDADSGDEPGASKIVWDCYENTTAYILIMDESGQIGHNTNYDISVTWENVVYPVTPTAISPSDDAVITTLTPNFNWSSYQNGGDGETQTGYQFRVRCDTDGDIIVYDTGFISSTSGHIHTYTPGAYSGTDPVTGDARVSQSLEYNKHYHWHVRYRDSGGDWSDWSADTPTTHQDFYTQVSPAISVTPSTWNFGLVEVGSSADTTFAVENIGGGTLTGNASVPAPFSIVSGGSYSLTAGQTQVVTVRFTPTAEDSYGEYVTFTGGSGVTRPVVGNGYLDPVISVTPSSRNYGSVEVGSFVDMTFTVQNAGGGTLTGSASVPAPFSIVSGGSYSLTAGQTQVVTVRFTPTAEQSYSESVTFTGGGGATRLVSGSGYLPPAISVTPASQDFGSVEIGSSADLTFTVQNVGGGTLTGSASVVAPFSIVSGGSYSLTAGQTQVVTVRFTPTAEQTYNQNVTFTGGGGATRPVSGSGYLPPAISVTPSSQDFGSVEIGSYAERTFTVENVGGGILTGSAIVPAPFGIASGVSYNLTAGQTQVVTVRFGPTAEQSYTENVTFTGGGGATRLVSGSGYLPSAITVKQDGVDIADDTGTYDFGTVYHDEGLYTTFTIENLGVLDLNLTGAPYIHVSGTDANDFIVTQQPTSPIIPGGQAVFEITFVPSGTGTRTAEVTIANDYSNENPYNFTLTGTYVLDMLPCDINLDGIVNLFDFSELAYWWMSSCSEPNWCGGSDFNRSSETNFNDLLYFSGCWLEQTQNQLEYTDNLSQFGINWYNYLQLPSLTETPPNGINLPAFTGDLQLYGKANFGDGANPEFNFAVDIFGLEDNLNSVNFYFDRNQNGDLTDDGGPFNNYSKIPSFDIPYSDGSVQPYSFIVHTWWNSSSGYVVSLLRDCAWTGSVDISPDHQDIAIFLMDNNGDGIYDLENEYIGVDINGDGIPDGGYQSEERIKISDPFYIDDYPYRVKTVSQDGTSITFEDAPAGTLFGSITSSVTSIGLEGAKIEVWGSTHRETLASDIGLYSIDIPEGNWSVRASLSGYIPVVLENLQIAAGELNAWDSELVPIPINHQGTVTLFNEDSYDFAKLERGTLGGGDFYFNGSFYANNNYQRGLIDLGDIGTIALDEVSPPASGYTRFGASAVIGHTYVSLAHEGEEGHIIFRVIAMSSDSVTLEFYFLNPNPVIPTEPVWVYINNDPGIDGHEPFSGQMSKYETINAQYCQFLNDALATGDIVVSGNSVYGAIGSNSGEDFDGQIYYDLAGTGSTQDGATNGGAARIDYNGSSFTVDDGFKNHPVTYVSWYGATAFCNYYGYRLPTEWEWQAVADYDSSYTFGHGPGSINNSLANYLGSSHPDGTTAVGVYGTIHEYGICDMAGNVSEWTSTVDGGFCAIRDGGWRNPATTVSYRASYDPSIQDYYYSLGFRVCRGVSMEGLVGYWSFDDGTATDFSGNGNNGTIAGDVVAVDGISGSAFTFDGDGDYIEVPDSNSLDITSEITLSAWIKPVTTSGTYVVLKREIVHGGGVYSLDIYPGTIRSNMVNAYGNTNIVADEWQHIAVTWDGSVSSVYYNGQLDGIANYTGSLTTGDGNVEIGRYSGGVPTPYFNGLIDEVRVYDRALSAPEIQLLYDYP